VRRDGGAEVVDSNWTQSVGHVALSPDPARLAVAIERATNTADVWVRELAGGAMSRLGADAVSMRPTWTPDGQDLLFVGWRNDEGGVPRGGVFRQAIGSREARFLFGHPLVRVIIVENFFEELKRLVPR
jgi:Tol biopolymer transport system component